MKQTLIALAIAYAVLFGLMALSFAVMHADVFPHISDELF